MAGPLEGILSPAGRRSVYAVYALIGVLVGGVQVAYGAVDAVAPDAFKIVLAVYAFVGTAIGATAASNVGAPGPTPGDQADALDPVEPAQANAS